MRQILITYIALMLMSVTCGEVSKKNVSPGLYEDDFTIPYLLNNPDKEFYLEKSLTEISGLTYSDRLDILYCINDEKGYIYGLSPETGEVIDKIYFGKSDDYEGIAYHDNMIYVAESNGNIKVVNEKTSERHTEYDDRLSSNNDIEGAVFNPINGKILLAAKGDSKEDGNDKDKKSIFLMHLEDGDIDKEPFISIDAMDAFKKLKKKAISNNTLVGMSISSRVSEFAPSGIAIHPMTNDLYILSARGTLLVVTNQQGDIKSIIFLDQASNLQPEGICFAPDGTLFISNEGRNRQGKISIFSYRP